MEDDRLKIVSIDDDCPCCGDDMLSIRCTGCDCQPDMVEPLTTGRGTFDWAMGQLKQFIVQVEHDANMGGGEAHGMEVVIGRLRAKVGRMEAARKGHLIKKRTPFPEEIQYCEQCDAVFDMQGYKPSKGVARMFGDWGWNGKNWFHKHDMKEGD